MIYSRTVAILKRVLPAPFFDLLVHVRQLSKQPHSDAEVFIAIVRERVGIEIGGPSSLFRTELPLYGAVKDLDGANFAQSTLWEGDLRAGQTFNFRPGSFGRQYIADATHLSEIPSGKYDFLLSSNCLEHVANPLRALGEWRRVLKVGGALVLAVPRKESNFDHRRPVTSFQHILDDLRNDIGENDLTHLDEILALHDLSLDPEAGSFEEFKTRSAENLNNRALHHHVFDLALIKHLAAFSNFDVVQGFSTAKDHVILAVRSERD